MQSLSSTLVSKLDTLLASYANFQVKKYGYQLYKVVNTGKNVYHIQCLTKAGLYIKNKLRFVPVEDIIMFIDKDINEESAIKG